MSGNNVGDWGDGQVTSSLTGEGILFVGGVSTHKQALETAEIMGRSSDRARELMEKSGLLQQIEG